MKEMSDEKGGLGILSPVSITLFQFTSFAEVLEKSRKPNVMALMTTTIETEVT